MIKDLKNVIITFGLIALVLTQGSLFYQKKVKAEDILATQQFELQNIKKNKLAKIAQNQSATPSTAGSVTTNQAQIDLAKKQATLLTQQKAQAQLLAQQQAQMTMRQSRRSRAS